MNALNAAEAQKLCEKFGIKFAKSAFVKNEKELPNAVKKVGFPLALKAVSTEILHKTDAGAVALNIQTLEQAQKALQDIAHNVKKKHPKAKISGFLVQKMLSGTELIIGGKQDAQFGATVLFGLGGIFVEVFKDFSLRICPIARADAREMIQEIKAYPILAGARGQKPVNMQRLEDLLLKANNLMLKTKVQELDLNPVIASGDELLAVDARVLK